MNTYSNNNKGIFRSLDWFTIGLYVVMLVWGWFSVCGASYSFDNPDVFAFSTHSGKQLVWIATSIALATMLLFVEKRFYYQSAYFFYGLMILLLVATIFIAPDTKGSRSWIPIGSVMKLQPAEFSKFVVALCLARFLDDHSQAHNASSISFTSLNVPVLKALVIFLLPMLIIVCQKETGSALVYCTFFLVLYREGMSGAILFTAFASVLYFVVGVRWNNDFIVNTPICIGEMSTLLLAFFFTIILTATYSPSAPRLFRKKRDGAPVSPSTLSLHPARVMLLTGGAVNVLAFLFAFFVIPFNVSIVLLIVNCLLVVYLLILSIYHKMGRYLLLATFALLSTVMYYASSQLLNHLQDHQRTRIEVLLGKKANIRKEGYNVNQAKIAIGSGGLSGKGFLSGTQTKLKFVPEQNTDFIFCTVGEEEGFIGAAGVLLCYLFFIWRLIALAERQPDTLGRVYGYCVLSIFLFHLFINVGMVLGLTPVIGIPLPFFSYGGSSLWGFTFLLFIFLRMDAERNLKEQ